jgi:hypothetical protein
MFREDRKKQGQSRQYQSCLFLLGEFPTRCLISFCWYGLTHISSCSYFTKKCLEPLGTFQYYLVQFEWLKPKSPSWSFPFRYSDQNFMCIGHLSYMLHVPSISSYFIWSRNNTWRIKIMKFLFCTFLHHPVTSISLVQNPSYQAGSFRGSALDLYLRGAFISNLSWNTACFYDIPMFLQVNVGIVPWLSQEHFFSNPFKFIIHLFILSTNTIVLVLKVLLHNPWRRYPLHICPDSVLFT